MPARLELKDLQVHFGGVRAIDGVNLVVGAGAIVGILGPNGSGKTTLLDVISGQLRPTAGEVYLDADDLVDYLPEDRAALGVVRSFQDCRLYPELTVADCLLVAEDARRPVGVLASTLHLPAARRSERDKRHAVDELIETFRLAAFRDRRINELSTGTRRVVDLAVVAAAQPKLLLLDEPTAGIAQREAEALGPLLRTLHQRTGATIVMVEHDVPMTVGLCDGLVVMEAGRVVSAGRTAAVLADPAAIDAYLGASMEALGAPGATPVTDARVILRREGRLMSAPALSVRFRRTWRRFRTEQPVTFQALSAALAALLVANLLAAAAIGSSTVAGVTGSVAGPNGPGGTTAPGSHGTTSTSTAHGGSAVGGSTSAGGGGPGTTGPGGTGGGPTSTGPGTTATGPLANLGNGVSATSIKVVFPWPNLGPIEQAIGLYGSSEDPVLAINAYVNAINDAGGINGRKIDPEIVSFDPLDQAAMRADCIQWTQDQHVFAVVDADAWHDDNQLCITQENHTPLISSWTTVNQYTMLGYPNLWWTGPSINEVLNNLVAWAVSQKDLVPGVNFAVVGADRTADVLSVRALDQYLGNAGLKPTVTGSMHFDFSETTTAILQADDIVSRLRSANVKTVVPLLPYTDFLFLVQAAQQQHYFPKWVMSDYEFENQTALGLIDPSSSGPYANELNNTVNPTFIDEGNCDCGKPLPQGYDAFGNYCNAQFNKYSGPQWYAENLKQTGNQWFGDIETTGTAMTWCTNIGLFAATARAVPPNQLTQQAFDQSMMNLTHFQGQLSPDYSFSASRQAGPHEFRVVEQHVNSDGKCPLHANGKSQGDCWLILKDWQPEMTT